MKTLAVFLKAQEPEYGYLNKKCLGIINTSSNEIEVCKAKFLELNKVISNACESEMNIDGSICYEIKFKILKDHDELMETKCECLVNEGKEPKLYYNLNSFLDEYTKKWNVSKNKSR